MQFGIFSTIILLAVAGATVGSKERLNYPQFLVGKTQIYDFTVNMTGGIQGMRPQVSKAVLFGKLKIYAKTKTELIFSMYNVLVSKTEASVPNSKTIVELKPDPVLEEYLKIPIKCHYVHGKVTRFTLSKNETVVSGKIKRTFLRSLELYLDKKVLHPPLEGRWPVSYNLTRESPVGNYTSLYTITSSPNEKFPQDVVVYNVTRTDNFENIAYDAYDTQNNFAKQGCPEVCAAGRNETKYAAGCPAGYETFETPLKKSFFQQHDLKFFDGVLIINKVTTVETHVADVYDQEMEIFISSTLTFKIVTLEKIPVPVHQNTFTNLDDFSNEINVSDIQKRTGYSNITEVEHLAKIFLQKSAEIVAKADMKSLDSKLLGEIIMTLRKLLTFLNVRNLRNIDATVVSYNKLPHARDVDKIKRQIWLDILPLIGTKESVFFIVDIMQENVNIPQPGLSIWEAVSILSALPRNINHVSEAILAYLSRLLELLSDREHPGFTVFYSASYITLARVIRIACAISPYEIQIVEDENKSIVDELNLILLRLTQKKHIPPKSTCPKLLVDNIIEDVVRKLRRTDDDAERIIYIQFLAQTGLGEALPHLLPYVFGRISGLTPSYIDYIKLVTVKALHSMVDLHPLDVQHIVLPVFLNRTEIHKVRMAAFSVFIKTNPSLGILQEIVQLSWSEPSIEVGSFVTSTLDTYGNSSLPCYQTLAHRIKQVLPQAKRLSRGYQRSKNYWWDIFDNLREFGFSQHVAYAQSNESFIPSFMYSSLAYYDHSFTDLVYQYAITTQGFEANVLWDHLLKAFDIPVAQPIPKNKEPVIFPKVKIAPRDLGFWRATVHQKIFYTDTFYYFDAHDVKTQKFVSFVMDYFRHYFPRNSKGIHEGYFVKLYMPSSYHAEAIGHALPYPVLFERDNVVLSALRLTSHLVKDKGSHKLLLSMQPSGYYSTLYTQQIFNLRDNRNVGVYHRINRNYATSIELSLAKEKNGRFNLTYRFPAIPKQTFTFDSEAGTYEGIRLRTNFSVMETLAPIKTIPSRFKRKEIKNCFGMPPISISSLTENILYGYEEPPKTLRGIILKFIRSYHDAGWRRASINITQLTVANEWSSHTTGSFSFQFNRTYPKTDLDQNSNTSVISNRFKRFCFSKFETKNLEEYLKEMQLIKDSFFEGTSASITDKINIVYLQREKNKIVSSVAVTLNYSRTLINVMQVADIKIEAKDHHHLVKPLKIEGTFTSGINNKENVFHYNDDTYDKAESIGFGKLAFSGSGPYSGFKMYLGVDIFIDPLNKTLNPELEFPLSNEFYLPETHKKCLKDVAKGDGYSKPCIKAIRERSTFNTFAGVILKNNKTMPPLIDVLLKKVAIFLRVPTDLPFVNDHSNDLKRVPFRITYIDKLTDEPIIEVNVTTQNDAPFVHNRMKSPIPFPYSIFSYEESLLARGSNNSFPAICALMDKYVTTFDLKDYPLPKHVPTCTYILAAHCMNTKRFAVMAKIDPHLPGSKEIHIYVGKDEIILTPSKGKSYSIQYNGKNIEISTHHSAILNLEQLIFAHMTDENLDILEIEARRTGIKVTYNGKNVMVQVSLLYKGELCGLCSDFNGETLREFRGVSGCLYTDSSDFAKSCTVGNCVKNSPNNPYMCRGSAMFSDVWNASVVEDELDVTDEPPSDVTTNIRVMRNMVLSRDDKLCFSNEELPTCEDNAIPKETEERNVGFVCYPESDPKSNQLLTDASLRVLTELESLESDFTENVEVAKSC